MALSSAIMAITCRKSDTQYVEELVVGQHDSLHDRPSARVIEDLRTSLIRSVHRQSYYGCSDPWTQKKKRIPLKLSPKNVNNNRACR